MVKVPEIITKNDNEIFSLKNENLSLQYQINENIAKIEELERASKQFREEALDEWFNKNPLKKYYKSVDSAYGHVSTHYIDITDEKAEKYDWNLKKLIEDECFLKVNRVEISYYRDGMVFDYAIYTNGNIISARSLRNPLFYGENYRDEWVPISEEEYLEGKKIAIDFIKKN